MVSINLLFIVFGLQLFYLNYCTKLVESSGIFIKNTHIWNKIKSNFENGCDKFSSFLFDLSKDIAVFLYSALYIFNNEFIIMCSQHSVTDISKQAN